MNRAQVLCAVASCALMAACSQERSSAPEPPVYDVDVAPILQAHCVSCHGDTNPAAGWIGTSFLGVIACVPTNVPATLPPDDEAPILAALQTAPHVGLLSNVEQSTLASFVAGGSPAYAAGVHDPSIIDPRSPGFHGTVLRHDEDVVVEHARLVLRQQPAIERGARDGLALGPVAVAELRGREQRVGRRGGACQKALTRKPCLDRRERALIQRQRGYRHDPTAARVGRAFSLHDMRDVHRGHGRMRAEALRSRARPRPREPFRIGGGRDGLPHRWLRARIDDPSTVLKLRRPALRAGSSFGATRGRSVQGPRSPAHGIQALTDQGTLVHGGGPLTIEVQLGASLARGDVPLRPLLPRVSRHS